MEQKKLSSKLAWMPARLVEKKDRWEIVYYQTDPADGTRKRHRETGDLNRIHDMKERRRQAAALVAKINKLLPDGYPYHTAEQIEVRKAAPTLKEAFQKALEIKLKTDKDETSKDYRSIGGVFLAWAQENGVGERPATEFTRRGALEYLDNVAERKNRFGVPLGNRTWNNYKVKTSTIFNELVKREYISENPFKGISKKAVWGKSRRKCTPDERALIAAWLWQHDYFCFVFITLEYYCLLRGTELRRLRAGDFDIQRGIITLSASKSKNARDRHPTMTDFVRQILSDVRFSRIPANYFVFGKNGVPDPHRSWGRGYAWRHLRKCMQDLVSAGKLGDIEGLSPYSFKDTGITDWLRLLPLPDVMQQAGHVNPGTTMVYNLPDLVNEGFKTLKKNILET